MITVLSMLITIMVSFGLLIFFKNPIWNICFKCFYAGFYKAKYKKDIDNLDKAMQQFFREKGFLFDINYCKEWVKEDWSIQGMKEGLTKSFSYWELALEMYIHALEKIQAKLINNHFVSFAGDLNFYLYRAKSISKYNSFELLVERRQIIELYKKLNCIINEIKENKRYIYTAIEKKKYDELLNIKGVVFIPYDNEESEVYTTNTIGINLVLKNKKKLFIPYSNILHIAEIMDTKSSSHKNIIIKTANTSFSITKALPPPP